MTACSSSATRTRPASRTPRPARRSIRTRAAARSRVAGGDQNAANNSSTELNNEQAAGGFIDIGDTTQSNTQSAATTQDIGQTSGGGIVLFGGDQNASNNSDTTLNDAQLAFGLLVLGDNAQSNTQAATTGQNLDQDAGGGTLVLFGGTQNASNSQSTTGGNCQEVGFGIFCFGPPDTP